jgi:hypothetical protein
VRLHPWRAVGASAQCPAENITAILNEGDRKEKEGEGEETFSNNNKIYPTFLSPFFSVSY